LTFRSCEMMCMSNMASFDTTQLCGLASVDTRRDRGDESMQSAICQLVSIRNAIFGLHFELTPPKWCQNFESTSHHENTTT
jgi:hypothetical protein